MRLKACSLEAALQKILIAPTLMENKVNYFRKIKFIVTEIPPSSFGVICLAIGLTWPSTDKWKEIVHPMAQKYLHEYENLNMPVWSILKIILSTETCYPNGEMSAVY